ncbi:MAG: class I SAM-dependent methyltransferase [Ferruginibacter sp.]|nr:class I SAM-dependent methyltransferase [Ferruginibacter sp.]
MNFISSVRQSVYDIFRLTYFFKVFYIRTRNELPVILNRRGLTGEGVEVGVWRGGFSDFLLKVWKGRKLYSVDPWKNFSSGVYVDDMNISQKEFDEIYLDVREMLSRFRERSQIIRDLSVNASLKFKDESLDFVYLDARHSYEGVKEDIQAWYNKIKPGGLICGHDYLDKTIGNTLFGVKTAVDEFAKARNLKPLITNKDIYPSWFILKPDN